MAEPKRLQLDSSKPLQREKKVKDVSPTYRFELHLKNIDSDFAEYSYSELVKEIRTQDNDSHSKYHGNEDPFSVDEEKEVEEIARRLEEKYNPKPSKKKKRKLGEFSEDHIDKGFGYDETDSFIDNEEAYDELVPSSLTTLHGGFYINKGELDFKNLMESETYEGKVKRKRIKQGTEKERKKRRLMFEENQKRRGRKPLSETQSALKPKKKSQLTVADMLQQQRADLQRLQHEGIQQLQLEPLKIERELELDDDDEEVDENDSNQPSTICEAIESVVKAAAEDVASNASIVSSDPEQLIENVTEAPKLPENLPSELEGVVTKLKEVAVYKSEEGKCKFFSDEVNRMLLSIELKAQELSSAQRSTIYAHLASHLPCTKETLQKRAKKLRLDQEDGKLREPMQRLKDGISAVMPELLEKYAALVKACDAKEEGKKNGTIAAIDGEESRGDSEKRIACLPKKRFEWNDTIRNYLCDVVRIKLKCYEVSKTRIQSAEEYLKHFLEAEVKKLWPEGWMQSRTLFRESRAAHCYITNRPKKQLLVAKKTNPFLTMKPNSIVPQEPEYDPIFHDKNVPFVPPVENVLEMPDVSILPPNNVVSAEERERASEFAKLFQLPIKSDDQPVNKMNSDISKPTSPHINASENVPPKPLISKAEKYSKTSQQSKLPPFSSKLTDFGSFSDRSGALASDMLARIICASLADFPYAGSHNAENTSSKATSVISPNPASIKDHRHMNLKFASDFATSPKKDSVKYNSETKKSSQDTGLHSFASFGINLDSFLNPTNQNVSRSSDGVKSKCLPSDHPTVVNLRLKDSIIPHPRQFAEAFERTADVLPVNKKNSLKGLNLQSPVSSTSPRLMSEHQTDAKLPYDLAKYTSTQSSVTQSYKKRTKYNKAAEQWPFLDTNLGMEGMKGFPFPVGALPTPPPAHSSSHLMRPKSDSPTEGQRRQSLIQGPWKSSPSQSPSTSHSHYINSTSPPISNQCQTTSPNHHNSNSILNMSPVPAHSMSQIDKVSSSYSPLPRASPSLHNHATKTFSTHLGQMTQQSSHTVSTTHHHAHMRSNVYDPIPTSTSGAFTINPEINPRTT